MERKDVQRLAFLALELIFVFIRPTSMPASDDYKFGAGLTMMDSRMW